MLSRFWNWIKSIFSKDTEQVPLPKPQPTPPPSTPPSTPGTETPTPPKHPTPAPTTGLRVIGNKIIGPDGNTFLFKGINIPDPWIMDKKYWERDGIGSKNVVDKALALMSPNAIRVPVLPGHKSGGEYWLHNPKLYLEEVLIPLVEYITSKGIYCIIDWHVLADWKGYVESTKEFWSLVTPFFKNHPLVVFEIINEPIYPDDWEALKREILQPTIDLIRGMNAENLIIVGSASWSAHLEPIPTSPCKGSNLAYTYHAYDRQGPEKWQRRAGVLSKFAPVVATETGFGVGETEGGTREGYGVPYMKFLNDHGIGWIAWCFSTKWGPRLVDSEWKLKDAGEFYRDQMK